MALESADAISLVDIVLLTIVAEVNVPLIFTPSLICMALESAELMLFNSIVPTLNVSSITTLPDPAVLNVKFALLLSALIIESFIVNPPR